MGRIRTVKPEFFKHEELFDAEQETGLPLRLAFAGLWCQADKAGRFKWRPRKLKTDVLPYDDVDFSRVLDALATRGWLVKYACGGDVYGAIPSWERHQVVNNRERESEIPPNGESLVIQPPTRAPRVGDACPESLGSYQGEREGKGREGEQGRGREETPLTPLRGARSDPTPYDGMVAAWNDGRGRLPGIRSAPNPKRKRALKRAWSDCLLFGGGDPAKAADAWALIVQRASEDAFYVQNGYGIDTVCGKTSRFLDEPAHLNGHDAEDDEPEETVDDYCRRCIPEWLRMTDAQREEAREWARGQIEANR